MYRLHHAVVLLVMLISLNAARPVCHISFLKSLIRMSATTVMMVQFFSLISTALWYECQASLSPERFSVHLLVVKIYNHISNPFPLLIISLQLRIHLHVNVFACHMMQLSMSLTQSLHLHLGDNGLVFLNLSVRGNNIQLVEYTWTVLWHHGTAEGPERSITKQHQRKKQKGRTNNSSNYIVFKKMILTLELKLKCSATKSGWHAGSKKRFINQIIA